MGGREGRRGRCECEEGAREKMEPSRLDGNMEAGSWSTGCCNLWDMVLEDMIRVGC